MAKLDGKIALVTGACDAGGIGAASAKAFIAEGAKVMLSGRRRQDGEALAHELGDDASFVELDVRDEDQWQRAVAQTTAHFGGLHILLNNAGVLLFHGVSELAVDEMRRVLDVNLIGMMLGTKHAAPQIIASGGGAIVNITSADSLKAMNGISSYVAAKWAARGFAKSAAMELAHQGVRVNSVHPGATFTKMSSAFVSDRAAFDKLAAHYPSQRSADPEEIASAVLFLASEDADHCIGIDLAVDGGMTLGEYSPMLPGTPD